MLWILYQIHTMTPWLASLQSLLWMNRRPRLHWSLGGCGPSIKCNHANGNIHIIILTSSWILLFSSCCTVQPFSNYQTRIVYLQGPCFSLKGYWLEANSRIHENALCTQFDLPPFPSNGHGTHVLFEHPFHLLFGTWKVLQFKNAKVKNLDRRYKIVTCKRLTVILKTSFCAAYHTPRIKFRMFFILKISQSSTANYA